jgi:hypothetical protein
MSYPNTWHDKLKMQSSGQDCATMGRNKTAN